MKKTLLTLVATAAMMSVASAQTVINPTNFPGKVEQTGNIINIVDDITLTGGADLPSSTYILDSTTFVNPGVVLTINPGVVVRGQPSPDLSTPPGSLVVSRGGFINANGLQTAPIIFTTAADTNRQRWESGDTFLDADPVKNPLPPVADPGVGDVPNVNLWGAVTLLGYAPTNCGPAGSRGTGVTGEAYVEGFGLTTEQVTYGGSLPNDSSGSLSYVSIRHSGRTIVDGDEQQGLTLAGVGAGTLLENIDIYCSGDDGIEIFGGTANLKNVIISYVNDDGFDLDQGWTGNAQFLFILASNITDASGLVTSDECGEWDGQDGVDDTTAAVQAVIDNYNADPSDENLLALNALTELEVLTTTGQPFMAPTIYNMTIFAEGAEGSLEIDAAFGGNIFNSIIFGVGANSFDIEDETSANPILSGFPSASPADRLLAGSLNINGVTFVTAVSDGTVTEADVGETEFADGVLLNDTSIALNSTTNEFINDSANPFFFGAAAPGSLFNTQETANGINPVPLLNANDDPQDPEDDLVPTVGAFFDAAPYRGAFPQDGTAIIFTTGWSALNVRGILVDAGDGADIIDSK